MSSSASGASEIVSAFRLPPPQPGRRSSSSGRAVATTSSGTSVDPVDELVDEVEQLVVGPVQVLEHEHGRALLRERLDEAAPRGEALVARAGLAARGRRAGAAAPRPTRRPRRGARPRRASRSFALGVRRRCRVSRMPACAFTISRERPERAALAVRQRAPVAPVRELGLALELVVELGDEPALADPGDADDRDELRRRARGGRARTRDSSSVALALAADERRRRGRAARRRRAPSPRRPPRPAPARPCPSRRPASCSR